MLPANIVGGINPPGVELLRRAVVDAADRQHQGGVGFGEVRRGRTIQRTRFVDGVQERPAQHEHRMFLAIERELVEAAQLIAFLASVPRE